MAYSAFPPADPILQGLAALQRKASTITMADAQRITARAMVTTLAVIVFIGGVLGALAKRSHQLLKGAIILLRILADLLERADDRIEQLILDNQPVAAATPEAAPTPCHHPLAQLAEDLMSNTAEELRAITGSKRKRAKQAMVNDFLAMSA